MENLCNDLVGMGDKLFVPLGSIASRPMNEHAVFVKRQLDQGIFVSGVALLVFDNADDYAIVRDFVPTGRNCRVVFSARDRLSYAGHRVLPLEPFAAPESMELLCAIIARPIDGDEKATAEALCEEVGHLPLAVEQLALFVKQSGASLASVVQGVVQSAALAGPLEHITVAAYERRASVVGALQLVQRHLSVPGRRVLQRLALLAPERVPRALLGPHPDASTAELSPRAMVSYPAPGLVRAHRLVLPVALGEMSDGDRLRVTGEVLVALAKHLDGFNIQKASTWGPMWAILPHAEAFAELKAVSSSWDSAFIAKMWMWVMKLVFWYSDTSLRDFATASRWAERATSDASALVPADPFVFLSRSIDVGWVLRLLDKTSEALSTCLPLLPQVAARLADAAGDCADGPDNAMSVASNLAMTLQQLGKSQEAVILLEQLLPILDARRGAEGIDTLKAQGEKALVLGQLGHVGRALNLLEDVLRVAEAQEMQHMFPYSHELADLREAQ